MAPVPIPYRCWDGPEYSGPTQGYQHHRAVGERPCPACRAAAAQYARDRRLAPQRRQVLLEALKGFDKYPTGRRERAA